MPTSPNAHESVLMGYLGTALPDLAVPSARASDEEMFRAVCIPRPVLIDGGSSRFRSQVEARRWVDQSGVGGCGGGNGGVGAAVGVRWWVGKVMNFWHPCVAWKGAKHSPEHSLQGSKS